MEQQRFIWRFLAGALASSAMVAGSGPSKLFALNLLALTEPDLEGWSRERRLVAGTTVAFFSPWFDSMWFGCWFGCWFWLSACTNPKGARGCAVLERTELGARPGFVPSVCEHDVLPAAVKGKRLIFFCRARWSPIT